MLRFFVAFYLLCLATAEANAGRVALLRSEPLPLGIEARVLSGYARFCLAKIADCIIPTVVERVALTEQLLSDLIEVNKLVNGSVKYVQNYDIIHYGHDRWSFPNNNEGDCEDFALEKRRLLEKRGVPRSALPIAVVKTSRGDWHAVLVIRTDKGDFVLDQRLPGVRPWKNTPYRYQWVQSIPTKTGGWFNWMTIKVSHGDTRR